MHNSFFYRASYVVVGAAWATTVAFGISRLWTYSADPGAAAAAPLNWPADAPIIPNSTLPSLVLTIHPHCPCSRATIGELAKLMTDCQGKLTATVLMLRPANAPAGWEQTDLWTSAAAIPGVRVVTDEHGEGAHDFGASTSGQALLYSPDGRLLFAGGITESRGHAGDNAGRSAITALVLDPATTSHPHPASTAVYGCPLFDDAGTCQKERSPTCRP